MVWHHLTAALRSLRRQLGYTVINAVGLAVGISVCLLISLYVRHEVTYDRFHEDADQIYRLVSDWGDGQAAPVGTWPAVQIIKDQHPDLSVTNFFEISAVVRHGEESFRENQAIVADPEFFDVFTFPVRSGTAKEAFERPYTAVLSPSMAQKYFGDADPVGQTVEIDSRWLRKPVDVTVAGVLEPLPDRSHFHPRFILSVETLDAAVNFRESQSDNWGSNFVRAYMKLPENASPQELAAEFTEQGKERAGELWNGASFELQRLTDIHLYSDLDEELEPNGSAAYVSVFAVVALFVLVLACVNFVNLATARAGERARAVGVRKTAGARQGELMRRYLSEAFVLSLLAVGLSLGLTAAGLPVFESITGIAFAPSVLFEPFTLGALAGITVVTAVGAGTYPALVLSRFDAVTVLQQAAPQTSQKGSPLLRQVLVVFQFATAVVLLAGTVVAYWQLNYLQEANLGFDREQVVTLDIPPAGEAEASSQAFLTALQQQPDIRMASQASESLPSELRAGNNFAFAGTWRSRDDLRGLRVVTVGADFFDVIGATPVAGRTFDADRPTDSSAVVLNRSAFDRLAGMLPAAERQPAAAIGRYVRAAGRWPADSTRLIGIVDDFRFTTLHEDVEPVIFFLQSSMINHYYARIDATDPAAALSQMRRTWEKVFPDAPFNYEFTDQSFAAAYQAEQRVGTLFAAFAGLAVFVACLGLLGLAAFLARQRTQEIGIRKAMGASSGQIVMLLSKDFAKLILGAIAVAVPVAYVLLDRWLDSFANHISLGPSVFLLAGGGALTVALLTVGIQAFRAARTDPAQVLRAE